MAFTSVRHVVRDVNGGWLLRSSHANGASFFFICLYAHIGRGLYYGRYLYLGTWLSGVLLLVLVIASAFLGYVLPWGQIRFWGATVITNLFSAIPYVGDTLVMWLWGGYSVSNATLSRFYTFHFIIPLLAAGIVFVHLIILHSTGRNNPLGISPSDKIPFHCYYTIKDIVGFVVFVIIFLIIILIFPLYLIEPDNYIIANPLSTPAHIIPEWYFLFAYAVLRSVPNKLGGVCALIASVAILVLIPFMSQFTMKRSCFYPMNKVLYWAFVLSFLMLTVGGAWPVEEPYIATRRVFACLYFTFFLCNIPLRALMD